MLRWLRIELSAAFLIEKLVRQKCGRTVRYGARLTCAFQEWYNYNYYWHNVLDLQSKCQLNTHQMFSVDTTYITSIILGQWNTTIILAFSFSKSSVFIMFYAHTKNNAGVFGLKSVFEKLFFRNGFLWTAGLAVKIMLHFENSPPLCERWLRVILFLKK